MIHYRLKLLFPTCILAFITTQVASSAELLQVLIDCRALPSAVARLDCYDQLVDAHAGSTNQAPRTKTAEQVEPSAAEPIGDISHETLFGKTEGEVRKSVEEATGSRNIDRIESRVSKIRTSNTGQAIITLENGQVWKQTDSSTLRLSDHDDVIIRRAIFGSYRLTKSGHNRPMRVKRIS